jgi:hypothetical protein
MVRIRNRPRHAPSARLGRPQPVEWRRKVPVPTPTKPTDVEKWDAFTEQVLRRPRFAMDRNRAI